MVPNHVIVCLLLFVSNMSLYYMSCIIYLNEIYFICVLARKPGSISLDCGLPETHIPNGEPTTHRDEDHHGYAMVVHRDKLYRSDQCGAPGITSWEVRHPSLWRPLTYLLPMFWWPIKSIFRSVHVNCIAFCMCLAVVWTTRSPSPMLGPIIIVWTLYAMNELKPKGLWLKYAFYGDQKLFLESF